MINNQTGSKWDLEERTTIFAKEVILLCKKIPQDVINRPIISQLVRSSGSIGANYREANDALGKKDFVQRLRISRKEAKETIHWLELLCTSNPDQKQEINRLINEATEIRNILSSIISKVV